MLTLLRLAHRHIGPALLGLVLALSPGTASAQTATVVRNVSLRSDASTKHPPLALLKPPVQLTLLSSKPRSGYYHVRTGAGQEGWVWGRNIQLGTVGGGGIQPPSVQPGAGTPGSSSTTGCGDGLWKHVYNPNRLLVQNACITVTGVIVDATASQSTHQPDGVRHEGDGDTHGWLKVDPQFQNLLNAGNTSDEGGNLVFELVCHFQVTQVDAKPACARFKDTTTIPPVGTHVAITGTFVQDSHHAKWNEIHPVSSIKVQ